MVKSARVIKRYIELLYHLQAFYQRIIDQLFDGSILLRNKYEETDWDVLSKQKRNDPSSLSSSSIFINHCRKITDQIQGAKPLWERKVRRSNGANRRRTVCFTVGRSAECLERHVHIWTSEFHHWGEERLDCSHCDELLSPRPHCYNAAPLCSMSSACWIVKKI